MDKNKVFYTRKLSALKKRFALTSVFSFAVCCFLTALCLFSPSVRASVPLSLRLLFILAVGCMCLLLIFALRIGYRLTDKIAAIYTLPDVTFPEPPHRMNTVMLLGLLLENMETIHSRQYQYQLLQKEHSLMPCRARYSLIFCTMPWTLSVAWHWQKTRCRLQK